MDVKTSSVEDSESEVDAGGVEAGEVKTGDETGVLGCLFRSLCSVLYSFV